MSTFPAVQNGVVLGVGNVFALGNTANSRSLPLADFAPTSPSTTYLESGRRSTLADAPGWAFSRSTANYAADLTGTLTSFAIDAPRVTDKGLLIEGAATNVLLQSQTFDNASWTSLISGSGLAPVVTANAATAPDGTATADQVVFSLNGGSASGDISMLSQALTGLSSSTAYAGGLWIKSATPCTILFRHVAGGAYSSLSVTTSWQRFTVAETSIAIVGDFQFGLRGVIGPTGSATVQVWGGQLETGSVNSSYIPTTTVAVARGADVATLTLSGASTADVTANGTTTRAAAASPLVLGAASGGAWVGSYVTRVVVR